MINTYTFRNKSFDKTDGCDNLRTIHFWWVISIMMVVIVGLSALLCTEILPCDNRIMTYLSFAATLLSIVLSIFAIMYSFFSMQDASKKWHDVDKAVSNIKIYTDNIRENNRQLLDHVISINKNMGKIQGYNDASNSINPQEMKEIETKNILDKGTL